MSKTIFTICVLSVLFALSLEASRNGHDLGADPYARTIIQSDTLPLEDRTSDFISEPPTNPFDLKDPGSIERSVEFDPETGQYIVTERIGDFNFRPPTYLTFDEYLAYRKKEEENSYFRQLAGIEGEEGGLGLDPMAKLDVASSLVDRLFGGTTVDIRPQGNIDLTFGGDFQRVDNPILTERQRTTGGFDFDMNIQMNVTGKIGEKLNLNTNYNTNATFDFDNQIKLNYNSDLFSEDEILKKIEAGNVSLPLRGNLIQGAQSLFGLKTELQFGRLFVTAIASQQQSQRENVQIERGAQVQEFEVKADEYDENRHFFLTHYNRNTFEFALENMPQIRSLFKIENLEVWITNDRNEVDNVRDIVAFSDLGETDNFVSPDRIMSNPNGPKDFRGDPLPDNIANDL
ncbi:MAG: cell surface protein SprA [Saprospiraceae bacterium]|nr:cell surface protein SprA [Saprospiraceae bacterium]